MAKPITKVNRQATTQCHSNNCRLGLRLFSRQSTISYPLRQRKCH